MTREEYIKILRATLNSAKAKKYAGYSKFDALNSPLLAFLSQRSAWLRFAFIQTVKVCPINLRPLFGVKISPNPKGVILFARAYLSLYETAHNEEDLKEAEVLLKWLIEHRIPNQEYYCWGYNYTWQDIPPFIQREGEPISIVTIFGGEAFIHAYEVTHNEEYLKIAVSAADFLVKKLAPLHETEEELAIAYTVNNEKTIVVNIQALTAALLAKVWKHTKDDTKLGIAKRLVNFVLKCKTTYDAWFYTFPADGSHIKHDNYHTGGVVDALLEYADITGDTRVMEVYWRGLGYYEKHLFEQNGAPRWMNDSRYPYDTHGAAQGIVSFSKAAKLKKEYAEVADRTADWAIMNLYRERTGDFRYRKGRFFNYDFSLMHWCNGWMARALGELIKNK
jgi:uncharacterized protein YyaL (SSP411 family)